MIDLDGKAGLESWALVCAENGEPRTLTATTGGGGTHLYYRYPPEEIRNSAGTRFGPGVDVRGEGGYVIAPPSFTEGPYRWSERREIAEAPAWMVERLTARPPGNERREGGTLPPPAAAEREGPLLPEGPIPYGIRNHTLFLLASSLRGRGLDAHEIAEELHRAYEERCEKAPPMPATERDEMARRVAARYPAGERRPRRKVAPPQVLDALARVEAAIWSADEAGEFRGSKSRRDVWISLVQRARKHGTLIPAGVRVSVSVRDLAGYAGVAPSTAQTSVDRLREEDRVRRDDAGRTGTNSGALVLVVPRGPGGGDRRKEPCTESVHKATHTTGLGLNGPGRSSVPISCSPDFSTFTAPRLRRSSPAQKAGKRGTITYEDAEGREHVRVRESRPRPATPAQKRLGKSRGAIIDHLEACGVLSYDELAARLAYARRDYVRRVLVRPLLEAKVVQESTGGVCLAPDWRVALEAERDRTKETELARRYKTRHRHERIVYLCRRMAWRGVPLERIAVRFGLTVEQVREIVRPADRAPSREEMRRRRQEEARAKRRALLTSPLGDARYRALLRMARTKQRVMTTRGAGWVFDVKGEEVRVVLDSDPSRWVPISGDELTGELAA